MLCCCSIEILKLLIRCSQFNFSLGPANHIATGTTQRKLHKPTLQPPQETLTKSGKTATRDSGDSVSILIARAQPTALGSPVLNAHESLRLPPALPEGPGEPPTSQLQHVQTPGTPRFSPKSKRQITGPA